MHAPNRLSEEKLLDLQTRIISALELADELSALDIGTSLDQARHQLNQLLEGMGLGGRITPVDVPFQISSFDTLGALEH